jgi:16S rRNA (cytidine1402-2'-O)-methyltransferase
MSSARKERRGSGTLFVVATPLGNLDDLSPRALSTLRSVAAIACEDTRRTSRLLARYDVDVATVSCHKFNERQRLEPILERLRAGDDVALVSDGGTPAVSDPGALLVRTALGEGLRVCPLPGPSAVATLLSVSGLPADRFVFDGFLPHRAGERRRRLRELRDESRTIVLFEAPHRLPAALRDIEEVLGPRQIVVGRELTKLHETILTGTAGELAKQLETERVRGEITLVLAGCGEETGQADATARRIVGCWRDALHANAGDRRAALRWAARALGLRKAELQRRLTELGVDDG